MASEPLLYVADTNVYLTAAIDPAFREQFEAFVISRGPLVVSTVVAAEVLIGDTDPAEHGTALRALTAGGVPGEGILAPAAADWVRAGAAVARLGREVGTKRRSFWNDALLTVQCARLGATLVTRNAADFRRLGRYLAVRAATPFP